MDSDYKLFDPEDKNIDSENEKKKKKKDHAAGYYKFINQFKNHIKKIENEYSGEDISQLTNYFNYINQYENEFEEQREDCLNCYSILKDQISLIEKIVPNFDITIFNTFFQTFEEYYSFFTKSQEVLKKFSEYNDETQNLFYICKRKNFCIEALKEFVDKISEEYADKIEQYEILNEKLKNLTESYDKLYSTYQETKSSDLKKYENIDNKELMIKKMDEKIKNLNIENDRIKKKFFDCSRDLEGLTMAIKVNYVLKSESEKHINELQFKMKKFETDNKVYKESIKNLKTENEKLIQEKEYLEEQINNQLNKINLSSGDNKNFSLSNLMEENEEKEEKEEGEEKEEKEKNDKEEKENESEELDDFKGGNDLAELLMDCEENETEEDKKSIENGQVKEDMKISPSNNDNNENHEIINVKNNNENKDNNDNNDNKDNKDNKDNDNDDNDDNNENNNTIDEIININEERANNDNIKKTVSFDCKNNILKSNLKKNKSVRLRAGNKKFRHGGSVKIRFNRKPTSNINSAYNIMFQGNQFPSRVPNKANFDYFKQFFFLLFQSMKMNSDKFEAFLGFNPETLYHQCRDEHIPFHKYQNWLEKQITKKEEIENEKKYEDFETITGVFCSSFI